MTQLAFSEVAAISWLVREGLTRDEAQERVKGARVAGRYDGDPFYYLKDLKGRKA